MARRVRRQLSSWPEGAGVCGRSVPAVVRRPWWGRRSRPFHIGEGGGHPPGVGETSCDGRRSRLHRRQVALPPGSSHASPHSRSPSAASSATVTLRL